MYGVYPHPFLFPSPTLPSCIDSSQVGTITLIALTGLLIFMFFLLVATANAIIVSVLMSLAAAGGFLAIFFACLVAVYIEQYQLVIFAISRLSSQQLLEL
ncbi:unnamed protein product [Miscanthus lutarioriparius]|uniref:Uncharacterized protein n=1 Tax=Miscanthus lutarioriparius TaxID=422564 RepID=A0A811QEQ7_9POAL|nr:unnamed protein product [Miscanthus lutarioriparius]